MSAYTVEHWPETNRYYVRAPSGELLRFTEPNADMSEATALDLAGVLNGERARRLQEHPTEKAQ